MPRWEIRARDKVVRKDAVNWLVALGLALEELGLDASTLTHFGCEPGPERSLVLHDPSSGLSLLLRPASEARVHYGHDNVSRGPARFTLAGGSLDEDTDRVQAPRNDEEHLFGDFGLDDLGDLDDDLTPGGSPMPMRLEMPPPSAANPEEPDAFTLFHSGGHSENARMPPDVAMRLLECGMEIATASSIEAASDQALTVLRQVVAAEGGAVMVLRDGGLHFIATQGPQSGQLRGTTIPRDAGFAGFVVHQGTPLLVPNASADIRHYNETDQRTGYRTRAVLAVPIRDGRNVIHGCLQLVNPPTRFLSWHMEAASSVAVALAESLRAQR